jgi:spore germination protein YaaH
MGKKFVECDIEPRTPLGSRYDTVPAGFKEEYYANDYVAINKYCDRVKIMAYDQANIDRKLNALTVGPYSPVADPRWVEKVISLATRPYPKRKFSSVSLPMGTSTRSLRLTNSYYDYKFVSAFNPAYATQIEAQYGLAPLRNSAGELSLTYIPTATLLTDGSMHLLWWSDSQAIKDKVELAKKYGLRGVSVFKIDGGADPGLWNVL